MFDENKKLNAFRDKLEQNGITLKVLWSVRRDGKRKRYDDAAMFAVQGYKTTITMFVVDYGKDGFGTWHDSDGSLSIDQEIEYICRHAGGRPLTDAA